MRQVTENRLDRALARRAEAGGSGLIIYITAGYPDLAATVDIIPRLFEAGADVIEVGMPFSDPLADGPTIQRAAQHALNQGLRLRGVLEAVAGLRGQGLEGALALMSYANPLLANGLLQQPAPLAEAGFDALIVPDMPAVESAALEEACARVGLHWIPFLAPTSTVDSIRRVAEGQGGFIYCVSVTGVTGARSSLPASTAMMLDRVRAEARRPVAVGFGVSGPEQARAMAAHADAVIVGSAVVERLADPQAAVNFVSQLREALDAAR